MWTFRGSPVGVVTGRSGDLDTVGRYRGTRDNGELKVMVVTQRVWTLISEGFLSTCLDYSNGLFKVISL